MDHVVIYESKYTTYDLYNICNRKEKYNLLGLLKTRREHNIDTYFQIN